MRLFYCLITYLLMLSSCAPKSKSTTDAANGEQKTTNNTTVPAFNADSAYHYVKKQVDFGPRVPNSEAHTACGNYFIEELTRLGAEVIEQKADLKNYAGLILRARNIIASYQKENTNRILLFAHWDTRPYSDHDPDPAKHRTPIDGANDGASGCGVLLEIARQLQQKQPAVGIDIIFFDAEDWGVPTFEERRNQDSGYCLGSNYWARNPHIPDYTARYGILLDMVGAPNATFYKEAYSKRYASRIQNKIWDTAQSLGFGGYFIQADGGAIEDDHVQVIEHRNIPCVDIIQLDPDSRTGFGHYWHTQEDSMHNISKETLHAVGQTLLQIIYNEK